MNGDNNGLRHRFYQGTSILWAFFDFIHVYLAIIGSTDEPTQVLQGELFFSS